MKTEDLMKDLEHEVKWRMEMLENLKVQRVHAEESFEKESHKLLHCPWCGKPQKRIKYLRSNGLRKDPGWHITCPEHGGIRIYHAGSEPFQKIRIPEGE